MLFQLQAEEEAKKMRPKETLEDKWFSASTTGLRFACTHALVWQRDIVKTHTMYVWHIWRGYIQFVVFNHVCLQTKSQLVFLQFARHKPLCYSGCVTDRHPRWPRVIIRGEKKQVRITVFFAMPVVCEPHPRSTSVIILGEKNQVCVTCVFVRGP